MPASSAVNMSRAQRIAAVFATACWPGALAHPAFALKAWFLDPVGKLPQAHHLQYLGGALEPWQRAAGAAVHLVPALLFGYGLLCARRSLLAFAKGEMFDGRMAAGLRDYAAFTFWATVANVAAWPAESLAITFANPPGQRLLSLGVTSGDLFGVLAAGILWVIASAIAQAGAVARENAQFV